nr:MAG TPA: transmembrane protein [Caudoviricetes sp.]
MVFFPFILSNLVNYLFSCFRCCLRQHRGVYSLIIMYILKSGTQT